MNLENNSFEKWEASPSKPTNIVVLFGFVSAFIAPIAGLVLSMKGREQCKQRGEDGENLAIAGIVISILNMVLIAVLLLLAILVPLVLLAHTATTNTSTREWQIGVIEQEITPGSWWDSTTPGDWSNETDAWGNFLPNTTEPAVELHENE